MSEARRWRLDALLAELAELYAQLPARLAPVARRVERVSGSTVPSVPVRLDVLDAAMPANVGRIRDALRPAYGVETVEVDVWLPARPDQPYGWHTVTMHRRVPLVGADGAPVMQASGDQVGRASAASVLDAWARDWATLRDEWLPPPRVATLVPWMRDRLEWACAEYEYIEDYISEVRAVAGQLRFIVEGAEVRPERLIGPCRRCDRRDLTRLAGDDRIECGSCGDLSTEDEYAQWVREAVKK